MPWRCCWINCPNAEGGGFDQTAKGIIKAAKMNAEKIYCGLAGGALLILWWQELQIRGNATDRTNQAVISNSYWKRPKNFVSLPFFRLTDVV
jgi:hypothetical protein